MGAVSAAKYTHPTGRDPTSGNPNRRAAAGPSTATITDSATMSSPPDTDTLHPWASRVSAVAAVLNRTVSTGSAAPIWAGMAPMPAAGTAESPSDRQRKITSNIRRDVSSSGSSWIPANRGRKNRSTIVSLNPSLRSISRVEMSSPASRVAGCTRRRRRRNRAIRSLSATVPIGASAVDGACRGARNGSETTLPLPLRHTSAPGSKAWRSRAARSSCRCASGYAVSSTWKPRSSWKPSTTSVRTRPPMPSLASSTVTVRPARWRVLAAVRPASPAPTMTTSGLVMPPCVRGRRRGRRRGWGARR